MFQNEFQTLLRKQMADSRELSLYILQNILENKSISSLSDTKSAEKETAFIRMLTLTALRHLVYIRNILKKLITKKLSKQNLVAQYALILGAIELLYMQTPDYAVINSYVNLAKKHTDKYIAGFVNAVLRKISASKQEFIKEDSGEFFPHDFRALLKKDYSTKTIDSIEKACLNEPLLDITCTNKDSEQRLKGQKLPLGTIRLPNNGKISDLPDYEKGLWWVQDFSSALPVKMLQDLSGKEVLELCAAPGGKTAQLLSAGAKVTCLDISEDRLKTLKENLSRLHLSPVDVLCRDALDFLKTNQKKYDIILLDAPCSATGTIRRHPEIAHLKTIEDVTRQAALQSDILALVDNSLAIGGTLLYCTCSLCKNEGEHQIDTFLTNHTNYRTENLNLLLPEELKQIGTPEGFVRILPQHLSKFGGADGFFIAVLKKGL